MHLTFQVADAGLFLRGRLIFFVGLIAAAVFFAAPAFAQNQPAPMEPIESFITSHCIDCHAGTDAEAGFDLESLSFDIDQFSKGSLDTTVWEKHCGAWMQGRCLPLRPIVRKKPIIKNSR